MIYIVLALLALGILLVAIRFVKGPTPSDRVVALDTLTIITTAGLVFLSLFFERSLYLDVSLIYGVLGFIGVLTIARYLEGGL